MNTLVTFTQLESVIIQQGIVSQRLVRPEADFRRDLRYKTGNLLELARLLNREFHLQLTAEQAGSLTTVQDTIDLLNQLESSSTLLNSLV